MEFIIPLLILIPLSGGMFLLWKSRPMGVNGDQRALAAGRTISAHDTALSSHERVPQIDQFVSLFLGSITFILAVILVMLVWSKVGMTGGYVIEGATIRPLVEFHPAWFAIKLSSTPTLKLSLGADGLGAIMVLLTSMMTCSVLYFASLTIPKKYAAYAGWTLVAESGLLLVFLSMDVLSFYIGFECVLIPIFALIAYWGNEDRIKVAKNFVLYTLAGSMPMIVGLIGILVKYQNPDGTITLLFTELSARAFTALPNESASSQMNLMLLFLLGLGIKMAIIPVHTWLPLTYQRSHSTTTALMAAVVLKMGIFGFYRLALPLLPAACLEVGPSIICVLGALAIVYGGLAALAQTEMRLLFAYSSISHVGFITIAVFALNQEGFMGGAIQMLNHGITTGALFLLATSIAARRGSYELDHGLRGIAKEYPLLTIAFMFFLLAGVGMPMLNNFVGEYLAITAMYSRSATLAAIGAIGIILGAWYSLKLAKDLLFGSSRGKPASSSDLTPITGDLKFKECLPLTLLAVLSLYLGIFPQQITNLLSPEITRLSAMYQKLESSPKIPGAQISVMNHQIESTLPTGVNP